MPLLSFSTSSGVQLTASRTVNVLSWDVGTESACSNNGRPASFPEIAAWSTESSEKTCSAVQVKPQNTLVVIDAITSLGRAFAMPRPPARTKFPCETISRPLIDVNGDVFRIGGCAPPVPLHQSAAARTLLNSQSGSPPPFFHDSGLIAGLDMIDENEPKSPVKESQE